jgi:hypothetical protein
LVSRMLWLFERVTEMALLQALSKAVEQASGPE